MDGLLSVEGKLGFLSCFVCLLLLLLYILKVQFNIFYAVETIKNKTNQIPMAADHETLSFKANEEEFVCTENGNLKVSIEGTANFHITVCYSTNLAQFKRGLDSKKSPIDLLHLVSLWISKPKSIDLSPGKKEKLEFDVQEITEKTVIKSILEKKPFEVAFYMETNDSGSSRVKSLTYFMEIDSTRKLKLQCLYLECFNGSVYPVKKFFNSGIEDPGSPSYGAPGSSSYGTCVICHHNPVTRLLVPCRHACLCRTCFYNVRECPVCREPVSATVQTGSEANVPASEQETRDNVSSNINEMGWWAFIKAVWNAG